MGRQMTNVESLKFQILSAMNKGIEWENTEAYKLIVAALPKEINGEFSEDFLNNMICNAFADLAEAMAKSTSIIIQIDPKDKLTKQSIGYCTADLS